MSVLEVIDLKKTYSSKHGGNRSKALSGISFQVDKGEFVGIMGPSGAGKSTLLNIIATIDQATTGEVVIGGQKLQTMDEDALAIFRREKLGFIFQDYNLLDTMTFRENIELPLVLSRERPENIRKKVDEVTKRLGITELLDKYPYEVSGGQRQRASAARAIISDPQLVLADEPTGNLDARNADSIFQLLGELNAAQGTAFLVVTHDLQLAKRMGRQLEMRDGRLNAELTLMGAE